MKKNRDGHSVMWLEVRTSEMLDVILIQLAR
jgi:hypothetical protein